MKKHVLSMLVLLAAVATGAMAQTETLLTTLTFGGSSTYSETTSGVVSVTATNVTAYNAEYGWLWYFEGSLSVTAKEGYTITKCVFRQNDKDPITDTEAPFEIHSTDDGITEDPNWDMDGVTSIEVYGYANAVAGYSVTMKEGTEDADKWTISPAKGLEGGETVTATYNGTKKVKSVKAVKKAMAPAEGKTYTNLQGGEVLHVGDKITETEGLFRSTHDENPKLSEYYTYIRSSKTYEVLRADVVDEGYDYKYTESPNGQYYVLKCTYFDYDDYEDWVTDYYFNQDLPVTGTSDGITVTLDGQDGDQYNLYTFWVHEPNP